MNYWLLKTEPEEWSWKQQVQSGTKGAEWNGVRNFQARKNLKKMKLNSKMILQVHDELVFECPVREKKAIESLVRKEMEEACTLSVPLVVDIGWGKNWNEAH